MGKLYEFGGKLSLTRTLNVEPGLGLAIPQVKMLTMLIALSMSSQRATDMSGTRLHAIRRRAASGIGAMVAPLVVR